MTSNKEPINIFYGLDQNTQYKTIDEFNLCSFDFYVHNRTFFNERCSQFLQPRSDDFETLHTTMFKKRATIDGRGHHSFNIQPEKGKVISVFPTLLNIYNFCKENGHNLIVNSYDPLQVLSVDENKKYTPINPNGDKEDSPDYHSSHLSRVIDAKIEINPSHESYNKHKIQYKSDPQTPLAIYFIINDVCGMSFDIENALLDIFSDLSSCVEIKEINKTDSAWMYYVNVLHDDFLTTNFKVNKVDCDVNFNYNDDLDYNKITKFINSQESGMIILHGKPGTGKTTLIRKLIWDNKDVKFYFLNRNILQHITDTSFISFLIEIKNSVIVFEDCEDIVQSRESGNSILSTILNLSDGILGDTLGFKFIFTFNSDTVDVDRALLRKGRTKYIYEFKELSLDKTIRLAFKLGARDGLIPTKKLVLSDIYNLDEDNNTKDIVNDKKVGF